MSLVSAKGNIAPPVIRGEMRSDKLSDNIAKGDIYALTEYMKRRGFYQLEDLFRRQSKKLLDYIFEGSTVLELGGLDGRYSEVAVTLGAERTVVVEARRKSIGLARTHEKVEFIQGDVRSLPVRKPFDVVILFGILYHVENPVELIRKVVPLVGKTLLISTHCQKGSKMIESYQGDMHGEGKGMLSALQVGHSFWLQEDSLVRLIRDCGLKVRELETWKENIAPASTDKPITWLVTERE